MAFRKVVWAEGVLLGQQHFQHWDSFLQKQQSLTYCHAHSFCWGLAELHWEESFLPQGVFRLNCCVALLKDGRWIDFNHQFDDVLSLKLPEQSITPLKVFLTIPETDYVSGISGYQALQKPPAWVADYQIVHDLYDASREREVLLGKQHLRLTLEDDIPSGSSAIQIAELEYNAQQASYRLSRNFIPPLLKISASGNLFAWIASWIGKMRQFLKLLQEQREKYRHVQNQFSYGDFIYFNLIKTITTYLPQMNLIQQSPHLPPFYLYSLCSFMIGELWGYTDSPLSEPDLPRFELQNLGDVFKKLRVRFDELVERITPVNTLDIPLQHVFEMQYQSDCLSESDLEEKQFCLALYHENLTQELINRILQCIKVAAPSRLINIVKSFTQGISLTYLASPGKDLLAKRNYHYFLMNKGCAEWREVIAEGRISFFISQDLAALPFELICYD
ncbi:type VI secretion system baseplate subunit TssK [Legionella londiniensis]|uniref:Type VI secretion protein n=1 Tax=Legionella londiniensis TaxID=45068 RepID=A0A0W0VSX0_9GAMM|nr:type VI secretion system baseplate subunit TssK [Legionella londiniensis]KTD23264.1 hypothetical protein Llon_0149 [Legionella londiniensis]STX93724.1 Uncharacterized protein conserved in bacteria [Legionella londiniensis]